MKQRIRSMQIFFFSFCIMVSWSFVKSQNCISALIYPWSFPKPFSVYTSHLSVFLMIMHARISFHVPAYLNQQPEDLDDDNEIHLKVEAQLQERRMLQNCMFRWRNGSVPLRPRVYRRNNYNNFDMCIVYSLPPVKSPF